MKEEIHTKYCLPEMYYSLEGHIHNATLATWSASWLGGQSF
jgi:hypothetical protein